MTYRLACAAAAAFVLLTTGGSGVRAQRGTAPQPEPQAPRLAVILVVDQMRADYVDRFRGDWTAGLKRLLDKGAWFSRAAYPYLTTVTCPGHATVSTGAFPRLHGVFQNAWYDRNAGRVQTCTEDGSVRGVAYGDGSAPGESPARLLLPSFADEMRAQRNARVVTLALKARSAIMLAGRGGDAVTWINDALDTWQTSTAFAAEPVPAVKAFVDANPIDADFGRTWERLMPPARYPEQDAGLGELTVRGWTTSFPHVLKGDPGDSDPDRDFYEQWQRSPYADAYVAKFAGALAESFQLGRRDTTDVLAISFSTPDLVGHAFGPHSQEIRDIYAHLDRSIGMLLDRLDALVGRNQYVVGLTSDHGVTDIPEQLQKAGQDGGRLNATRLYDAVERVAQAAAGPGSYLARMTGNDVYFRPGMYDRLAAAPAALSAVIREIEQQPGIARAFARDAVLKGATSTDPVLRAAALSYVVGRSGDMILALKPGWVFSATGATHGSANPTDQRVPIVLMGARIKPGEYDTAATPADVAPTLAALVGITMLRSEGRPLLDAIVK